VVFEDLSTNTPTSWAWNFGDATTSVVQNPTKTYAEAGMFKVILIASNADGAGTEFSFWIVVSADARMNITVEKMVEYELPSGVTIDAIQLSQYVRKWQIFLQPLMEGDYEVALVDIFDQSAWHSLANVLIAKLVIYDYIMAESKKSTIPGTTGMGALKSIETGPSKTEWHDNSKFWESMFADGGFILVLTSEICLLAGQFKIALPGICKPLIGNPMFIIARNTGLYE
jgi:PKD repeat protein